MWYTCMRRSAILFSEGMIVKMAYRYDLHCHTSEGSKCSDISIDEMIELYHEIGFSGFCVTDHFTSSMNPLTDDASWEERVNLSYDIFQKAHKKSLKFGLSVFFGIEYRLTPDIDRASQAYGADFIFLNIEKDWLLNNKCIFREKPDILFDKAREAGVFIIHAHPMFGRELTLFPYSVDAVEIINGGFNNAGDICNVNAKKYAEMYDLLETAGTDIHRFDQQLITGIEMEKPCFTVVELINTIKQKNATLYHTTRKITDYWQEKQNKASEIRKKSNR